MAQPPEIARIAAELGDLARRAWAGIQAALARLTGRQAQSRTLHRQIQAAVGAEMTRLRAGILDWARDRLPRIFARGDAAAAGMLGTTSTAVDVAASRALQQAVAREMVAKALVATRNVEESTKLLLRRVAADEVLGAMRRNRTFEQVPARVAEIMRSHGVYAVRYANGAKHQIDDYMDMLTRTVAARAYNAAVLERGRRHGIMAVEVQDGAGCTWPVSHGQPPEANGLVVSVELFEAFPIAHPRCVRAPLLRADIRDPAELDDGELPTAPVVDTAEQEYYRQRVAEELAAELRREQTAARRPSRLDARRRRLEARARRLAERAAAREAEAEAAGVLDGLDVG